MKCSGSVTYIGVNSFDNDVLDATAASALDCAMLQYNILDRSSSRMIAKFAAAGKFVVSGTLRAQKGLQFRLAELASPRGLWYLARLLKNDPFFYAKARRVRKLAKAHDVDVMGLAIRFVTGNDLITSSTFNTTRLAHLAGNIERASEPVSEELALAIATLAQE